ncbi:MAG: malate dehydrogenase [Deltaproteobacteria bacterium]|nr:malate dehydrogenase [Sandaracinaceae bacterium]MCX7808920.1 malate dehydrogenase [Deltaproteobacteria bacterium]
MAQRKKIAIIGAGNIGGELAMLVARRELGDCVLLDLPERADFARGKALDIMQTGALKGFDCRVIGTSDYAEIEGSDVVIVTAGVPRKPGMSREDLLAVNLKIIRTVAEGVRTHAPSAFVIVISNPLDAMVYEMKKRTGFPRERVVGMAGVLDSARMQFFLAEALGVSVKDVRALVLGGHGDTMVPVLSYCTVNGVPVRQLLPRETLDAIVKRTAGGGGEIVKLMGTSAYYAPAEGAMTMAEAYLRDEKRLLACAAYLQGEYGYHDLYMGVPVIIGGKGVERVVEIELTPEEKALLDRSAEAVRNLINEASRL